MAEQHSVNTAPESYSIEAFFRGKSVLVTGATGFLAKALVEKMLHDLHELNRIYLLIRPRAKSDGTLIEPRERLHEEIFRNSAFKRLRERLGPRFESWCEEKVEVVSGDLTTENFGLEPEAFAALASKIDLIVHSAATVNFDEKLDLALALNTLGPGRLLELARLAGGTYVHISTAYVCGMRTGSIEECLQEPLKAIDAQLAADKPRPERFDVLEEVSRLQALCDSIKRECEQQRIRNGWAEESEEARSSLERALVNAGMNRARSLGWNDTYTYTKFLGEQLLRLRQGEVPLMIVRPSIIESSLRDPEPGWISGLRMADPIIIGFGKGRLTDFPAKRDMPLDVIPADMVVNASLAAAAWIGGRKGAFDLIHVATSAENPLVFDNLYRIVRSYFMKHPMLDKKGKPIKVPVWNFPSVEQFRRNVQNRYVRPMKVAGALLNVPLPVPGKRHLRARLRHFNTALDTIMNYVDIYSPYTNLDVRFEIRRALQIFERMHPAEKGRFDFDSRKVLWRQYLQEVHIPGLKRNILRMEGPLKAGPRDDTMLSEEAERGRQRMSPAIHGVPRTIVELAIRGADQFEDKVALEMRREHPDGAVQDVRVTYRQLVDQATRWARLLKGRLQAERGECIALWSENSPEWAVAYLAIVRAGFTAVPLDRQLPPEDILQLVLHVEARALIVTPSLSGSVQDTLAQFNVGVEDRPVFLNLLNELQPYDGFVWPRSDAKLEEITLEDPLPETLSSILFTSGTTLAPKGVMLSHGNFVSNALAVAEILEPYREDRFLSVLPLHHCFEFTGGLLVPLLGGATVHYVEQLRGDALVETMKRVGITVMLGVPAIFRRFAEKIQTKLAAGGSTAKVAMALMKGVAGAAEAIGNDRLRKRIFKKLHDGFGGKLRCFVSGGAGLDPEIFYFFQRFGVPIVEGYGLTETSPIVSVNPLGAPKAGSVGLPLPGVEIKLEYPDRNGVGQVLVRGPSVMHGYYADPEATEQVFERGWFKTGDLGRLDNEGYLYITGRIKHVIVSESGKKVYPDEIERCFKAIAGIREYCVIGLPARQGGGEEVAMVVVPEPSARHEEIRAEIERASKALASHQRISRILFQSEPLPRTSTLKVKRNVLQERYATQVEPRPNSLKAPLEPTRATPADTARERIFREIAQAIAEVASVDSSSITPDKRLQLDLGIDSIGRVDLVGRLEIRLNVGIPEEALAKLWTVEDVFKAVSGELADSSGSSQRRSSMQDRLKQNTSETSNLPIGPTFSKTILQGAMNTTAKVVFNTWLSIDATGLEHVPTQGAYILASNHSSHLDTAAIREVLGKRRGELHVMGAKDYFYDTRLKAWFYSTLFNTLPFDRHGASLEGLRICREVLDRGMPVLIFPEATRTTTGKLLPFKAGSIGIMALEFDVPVIPVFISGTFESLPKGRSLPRRGEVVVRFGKPVDLSGMKAERDRRRRERVLEPKAGDGDKPRHQPQGMRDLYRKASAEIQEAVERLRQ